MTSIPGAPSHIRPIVGLPTRMPPTPEVERERC